MSLADNPTRYDPDKVYLVLLSEDGFVMDESDLREWAADPDSGEHPDPEEFVIVTGTAVPRSQSQRVDDFHRSPGSYLSADRLAERDLYGAEPSEVLRVFDKLNGAVTHGDD